MARQNVKFLAPNPQDHSTKQYCLVAQGCLTSTRQLYQSSCTSYTANAVFKISKFRAHNRVEQYIGKLDAHVLHDTAYMKYVSILPD